MVTDVLQAEHNEEETLPKFSENDLMLALVDLTNEAFADAGQCAQLRLLLEVSIESDKDHVERVMGMSIESICFD